MNNNTKTIFVIEDDRNIRTLTAQLLQAEGYKTQQAANGKIALDLLDAGHHADVFILDVNMPVMDGYQFYTKIKSMPKYASVPILLMSASTNLDAFPTVQGIVSKPVDIDGLLEKVSKALVTTDSETVNTI